MFILFRKKSRNTKLKKKVINLMAMQENMLILPPLNASSQTIFLLKNKKL